jgi:copper chaperone CopZ
MTCGHCEMSVKKAVMRLDPQARESLAHVITDEGYQVA